MQIPLSAILIILGIGSLLLAPLLFLPTLRRGVWAIKNIPRFSWPVLILFALLFWPNDPGQAYAGDVQLGMQRLFRVAIMSGLFLFLLRRFMKAAIWFKPSILNFYLLYVVACFGSVAYAPDWQESLWKSIELVVVFMFAVVVRADLRRGLFQVDDVVALYTLLLFVAVLFALVAWLTFPNYAVDQWTFEESESLSKSLGGVVPRVNPNSLGQFSAMLLFAGIASWVFRGRLSKENIALIAVGGTALILAHARTSSVAVIVLTVALLVISKRGASKLMLGGIVAAGILSIAVVVEFFLRGQDVDMLMSMSGRTEMWTIAWPVIQENPWFGIGIGGHKKLDISLGMEFSSLDSTYVEAMVGVGLIGTSFLVMFVLVAVLRTSALAMRSLRSKAAPHSFCLIAGGFVFLMFVRSLVGPSFQLLHWNLVMLLTLVVAMLESGRGMKKIIGRSTIGCK